MKKIIFLFVLFIYCSENTILAQQAFVEQNKKKNFEKINSVTVKENVEFYLEQIKFLDKIRIFEEKIDRVYAYDLSEGEIINILNSDKKNWIRDMFQSSWAHKDAIRSWRYLGKGPSLQITQVRQKEGWILELDIDKNCPRWKNPFRTIIHLTTEVFPNKFFGKYTDQSQIKRLLEKRFK